MTTAGFDPEAPLPGPPDPWESTSTPSPRTGPPYHMTEMIAVEPALAERLLGRLGGADSGAARLAAAIREETRFGDPIVVTGCGTSEHAALGVADILAEAMREAGAAGPRPVAAQAFELALDPPASGLVIGISHEGGTAATNRALEASRAAGAPDRAHHGVRPARRARPSPTSSSRPMSSTRAGATRSATWRRCSRRPRSRPLSGERRTPGRIRRAHGGGGRRTSLGRGDGRDPRRRAPPHRHRRPARTGPRRASCLKIEEAAWLPSAMPDLETFLHGHLPATDESTGLVLILTDRDGRAERAGPRPRRRSPAAAASASSAPRSSPPTRRLRSTQP